MPALHWIRKHTQILILTLIVSLLCIKNYTPGTYLIGWDNLMPELNIWLNLKRSLLAVWQQYQGLGLVGGMGHATDFIRQLLILPFTLILPNSLIRYLWHFAMIYLGTFGVYFGLKETFPKPLIAFCSALFYLLNFGSIQYFWVPFEPFSTFWGFFPWLIFSLENYLSKPSPKNLKIFLLLNILAIPSFYIQTIFIVYLLCIFTLLFCHFLCHPKFTSIKKSFITFTLIITVNAFWLLPFTYFLKNNLAAPRQAYGNLMATQETLNRNQLRGTLSDFALLRSYYYDFPASDSYLMAPWINHFSNFYFLICGYFLFVLVIIGLISPLFKKNERTPFSLFIVFLFLISCIALLTTTTPFSQINSFFRQFSFLDQVFRSPWTKFVVPTIFSFTLLSAHGLDTLIKLFTSIKYSKTSTPLFISSLFLIVLGSLTFPSFLGQYISPKMRNVIPSEYLKLFRFFNQLPATGRIAIFPQGSFWGWTNYKWKTSGSGFLWYSLPQPILDRAFDVWNLKNEQYYWELTSAIQQSNPLALQSIFDKYSIEYVVFDNNVFFPDEKIYSKLSTPTKELLTLVPGLKLITTFNRLVIFQYQNPTKLFEISTIIDTPPITTFQNNFPIPTDLNFSQAIKPNSHSPLENPKTIVVSDSFDSFFHLENKLSHNLLGFNFPTLSFDRDYLLKIDSRNLKGYPLTVSVFDDNSHFKFLFSKLNQNSDWRSQYYLIPKMEKKSFDLGLTVLFDNSGFNQIPSSNDLREPLIIPYNSQTDLIEQYRSPPRNYLNSSNHTFFYQTKTSDQNQKYLVLPQSHDSGWIAFHLDKLIPRFLQHLTINNWANGWNIENVNNQTIYILFWPQLLEFLGFGLLFTIPLLISRWHTGAK